MDSDHATPIFLIGFMGAGKTTVGRSLAKKLGAQFLDLDEMIEIRIGRPVRHIFAEMGEPAFRGLEREAIASCSSLENTIVALGGGAYSSEENRTLLRSIGTTVWIDCPLEVCMIRISTDSGRPLAGTHSEMAALLKRRRLDYEQADRVIRVGAQGAGRVAQMIIDLLNREVPPCPTADEGA